MSIQKGDNDFSIGGIQGTIVLAVEFLPVSAMLSLCPYEHLKSAHAHKQNARDGLSHKIKTYPG